MYFMIWRPQSRRAREMRELASALTKGDEVVTSSGILGVLTKVTETHIHLQPSDGIELVMQKSAVSSLLPKGTLKSL